MALITDYTTLQDAVASYLKRDDLTGDIPMLIQLAESRLNRDVKSPRMLVKTTGSIVSYLIPIPTPAPGSSVRFMEVAALSVTIGGRDLALEPITPAGGIDQTIGGIPRSYYVLGSNFVTIGGTGTEAYSLTYKASMPTITSALNSYTNWLLDRAPELFLYASLLEASPFIKNDARIAVWAEGYRAALDTLNEQEARLTRGPGARIKPVHYAP